MKTAVIGSRTLIVPSLGDYLPEEVTAIISGGAVGIDSVAREYAQENGIPLTEFLPDYEKYGRAAPIVRNRLIVDAADVVIVFWDGESKGTKSVIDYSRRKKKEIRIFIQTAPGKYMEYNG